MKMPRASRTGSGVEVSRNSRAPVTHNTTVCHYSETQRLAPKLRVRTQAPSKTKRVQRQRRAGLRKMRVLQRKRRELCGALGGQREGGVETEPGSNPGRVKVALAELWEEDSGFCSEVSPTASGRSSPCAVIGQAAPPCTVTGQALLVSMDCEMVGTGPEGRRSELARCSLVGYHGDVLYDRYIRPRQPVTDYRTKWSGIRQHHLLQAVPFQQARTEILQVLDGKVVVGHALHNDFRALGFVPPRHMIRDTSCTRLLRQLSNTPARGNVSLKSLAKALLHRDIQMGRRGHSSVEDALAAMDLYKLVESQWEQDVLNIGTYPDPSPAPAPGPSPNHYMEDQYWPADLMED